jgi:hypothetical protein
MRPVLAQIASDDPDPGALEAARNLLAEAN